MRFIASGLGNWHWSWKLIEEGVEVADELGFWGVVMPDHYMWGEPFGNRIPNPHTTVDTWTALTYLAARTQKIKLGTLVTPIPFRPPAMLAKIVSTLDNLSNGRTVLGVGAGWSKVEFEGYSEWNEPKTRVNKTEEGVRLILRLWQEPSVDFNGRFYHAKGAVLEPKPVQRPHPPLLFGGTGTRMLRMAARYGDICFIPSWVPFDDAKKVVAGAAIEAGRSSRLKYATGSPRSPEHYDDSMMRTEVEKAQKAGCEYYLVSFPENDYVGSMRRFADEVIASYAVASG